MNADLLQQLEARMAELDAQHGRRRHPLTPFSPHPRDNRLRADVFEKLRLPKTFEAHRATKEAFAARQGTYAHLLVGRTAEVVEAFLFQGQPGIRAALVDLAAFALLLADSVAPSTTKPPRTTP